MAGFDGLYTVKKVWNIDDLMDAHEVLDAKAEAERQEVEKAKR